MVKFGGIDCWFIDWPLPFESAVRALSARFENVINTIGLLSHYEPSADNGASKYFVRMRQSARHIAPLKIARVENSGEGDAYGNS